MRLLTLRAWNSGIKTIYMYVSTYYIYIYIIFPFNVSTDTTGQILRTSNSNRLVFTMMRMSASEYMYIYFFAQYGQRFHHDRCYSVARKCVEIQWLSWILIVLRTTALTIYFTSKSLRLECFFSWWFWYSGGPDSLGIHVPTSMHKVMLDKVYMIMYKVMLDTYCCGTFRNPARVFFYRGLNMIKV